VKQPAFDPSTPNATLPENMRAVLSWPDEQVTAMLSQNEPPVKLTLSEKPATTEADDARG
jgi:hypothetical protein